MKLQELTDQGYELRAWMLATIRGERRVVLKLKRREKLYVAHSPFVDTTLSDVEFTAPVLVSGRAVQGRAGFGEMIWKG